MTTKIYFPILFFLILVISCGNKPQSGENSDKMVLIKTKFGNMKVKLYNETPLHRDNFLKLTREGFYNDLLFHRVIKDFMIQGGDPGSKGASPKKQLGGGDLGYLIPAEINSKFFHKKGALAAARTGDNINPERKSSASQFYIVQGRVYNEPTLQRFEEKQKIQMIQAEVNKISRIRQKEIQRLQKEEKMDSVEIIKNEIIKRAENQVDVSKYSFSSEQRKIYSTLGGTPQLDGAYTVFGEVVEGLNIIDSIANVKTAPGDRPIEDVKFQIVEIK
jgi:cyclophilin family peptidyl-prolyl cis-trans isomerase